MDARINNIKEVFYVTGTYPDFDLLLYEHFHNKDSQLQWLLFDHTWLVYLDFKDRSKVLCISQSTEPFLIKPKKSFKDRLIDLEEYNLENLSYLCTVYNQTSFDIDPFSYHNSNVQILSQLTQNTYGRIAYTSQALEILINYSDLSVSEAKQLVKGLKVGNADAFEKSKHIKINNSLSYFDLITNSTLDLLYEPQIKEAKFLLNYLEFKI